MNIETIAVKIAGNPLFTENCYIVSASKAADCVVVIDPGDEPECIMEFIGERTLEAIIITHGHYDHIGGVAFLAYQTGAKVYAHENDAAFIKENFETIRKGYSQFTQRMNARNKNFKEPALTAEGPRIDVLLKGEENLELCGLDFKILHTPGHSPGSICLYLPAQGVLFSGDTLFFGTCGRTDFTGGNPKAMHDSLAKLSQLPPQTIVYPGHEQSTTIGAELNRGLSEY